MNGGGRTFITRAAQKIVEAGGSLRDVQQLAGHANLGRAAERVVAFYNQRGTAEQHIKEGKNAIQWTRLSCRKFRDNEVRLQLHALAYNLANFMRTLALPKEVEHWSLTTLREHLRRNVRLQETHTRHNQSQRSEEEGQRLEGHKKVSGGEQQGA